MNKGVTVIHGTCWRDFVRDTITLRGINYTWHHLVCNYAFANNAITMPPPPKDVTEKINEALAEISDRAWELQLMSREEGMRLGLVTVRGD